MNHSREQGQPLDLRAARQALREAEQQLQESRAEQRRAEERLAALAQRGIAETDPAWRQESTARDEAQRQAAAQRDAIRQLRAAIRAGVALAAPAPQAAPRAAGPGDNAPYLLMPVRVETRFVHNHPQGGAPYELWVRIYPDTIAVDSHEPALTDEEAADGQAFWREICQAPAGAEQTAWARLVAVYPAPRAAWIVQQTTPSNPDAQRPEDLIFPAAPSKPDAWSQPPVSRVLPDRWTVLAYVGGQQVAQVEGNPIPDPLVAGPNPDPPEGSNSLLDEDAAWMVNFDEALAVGMAVRIPFANQQAYDRGFDRLVVLGVKDAGLAPTDGPLLLAELIDAHRFTNTFAIAPQGTPTNNTPSGRSGYATMEEDSDASLSLLRGAPQYVVTLDAQEAADGQRLAESLGLPPDALQRVARAGGQEEQNARAMATLLWPVTWGYYLRHMAGQQLDPNLIDEAREYALNWVRGRGPLAAVRVGNTPYGILPVATFEGWEPADPFEQRLFELLHRLLPEWAQAAQQTPRIQPNGDPERAIVETLGMQPSASEYSVRRAASINAYAALMALQRNPLRADLLWAQRNKTAQPWQELGFGEFDGPAPFSMLVHDTYRHHWRHPLIQADPLSETESLTNNYLRPILEMMENRLDGLYTLRDPQFAKELAPERPLLCQLAIHAALRAIVDTAYAVAERQGLGIERVEPEFVNIQQQKTTLTPWELLAEPGFNLPDGADTLGDLLAQPTHELPKIAEVRPLLEFKAALERLYNLPTAELERLLTETLDTASHRLDAWFTSLAAKRLWALRSQNPDQGIRLGGYGWLEGLRPSAPPTPAPPGELIDEHLLPTPGPVTVDPDNEGYILAPSINHATAAAVLRNGYRGRSANSDANDLAINLSSRRVRRALALMDGIRAGQPLAALLGYRFERGLHEGHPELELDRYIHTLRKLYPLETTQVAYAADEEPPRNVVDGLRLLREWQAHMIPFGQHGLPLANATPGSTERLDYDAIVAELDHLGDDVDSLGDVGLTESVYQLVNGNPTRAGAILNAIAGDGVPAEPDVARIPAGGASVTHRAMLLFTSTSGLTSGWNNSTPRARAEPALNNWLNFMFGDPYRVRCRVLAMVPGASTPKEYLYPLANLGLGPIDLIYLPGLEGQGGATELEERVRAAILAFQPPGATLTIDFGRQPGWSRTIVSYDELLELARQLRDLVTRARPLEPADFALPSGSGGYQALVYLNELTNRVNQANGSLVSANNTLRALLAGIDAGGTVNVTDLRNALIMLARFGLYGAFPPYVDPADSAQVDALVARARSVLEESEQRAALAGPPLAEAQTLQANLPPSGEARDAAAAQVVALLVEAARHLFGEAFQLLPKFRPPQDAVVGATLENQGALLAGDVDAPLRWFQQAARVRPALERCETATLLSEAVGRPGMELRVGQLPYAANQRWIGLPLAATQPPPQGLLSLVAFTPMGYNKNAPYAGLMLDYVQERIPTDDQTAAIACHFDQPGARPPQSILLAVPPSLHQPWQWDDLVRVVNNTLDLAKVRAVDLDALNRVGHQLPAIVMAVNHEEATVSTDLVRMLMTEEK